MNATPILILGYNRNIIFSLITKLDSFGYRNIYVSIDGPKNSRDKRMIEEIKQFLILKKNENKISEFRFSRKNTGCKLAVTRGITWFFNFTDSGIILEDDIDPSVSFLKYSEELLLKLSHEKQVFLISGDNFFTEKSADLSYDFIEAAPIWGWATWKDRWNDHLNFLKQFSIEELESKKTKFSSGAFFNISKVLQGKIDSWAYLLLADIVINQRLSAVPKKHLIQNIGLKNATHTKFKLFQFLVPREELHFPLRHPKKIIENKKMSTKFNNLHSKKFLLKKTIEWYLIVFFKRINNFFQTK